MSQTHHDVCVEPREIENTMLTSVYTSLQNYKFTVSAQGINFILACFQTNQGDLW